MTDVLMPLLGEGMEEGTISRWFVATGDRVATGAEIAEIETDKVTMALVAEADGVIEILVGEGETAAVGAPIARVGATVAFDGNVDGAGSEGVPAPTVDAAPDAAGDSAPAAEPVGAEVNGAHAVEAVAIAAATAGKRVRATPLARLVAGKHGIDLERVAGSGPGGLVTRHDLGLEATPTAPRRAAPGRSRAAATTTPVEIPDGATVIELTRAQRVIADRMTEAKATVPEFQVQADVWMDALVALRDQAKAVREQPPSLNDLVVKAVALALVEHPRVNGFYDDGRLVLSPEINVGVAVAAEGTLVVPVVRNADRLSIGAIAAETRRLAEAVRTGAVTMGDLRGGTFTVSNLGMFGMTAITPILNLPQAAILGVGAARETVRFDGERPVKAHVATLTLTCDHRILYGADAARFLSRVRELLERPVALLLD